VKQRLRSFFGRIRGAAFWLMVAAIKIPRPDVSDVIVLVGLLLLTVGLGLYSVPLALSVLGVLLLVGGLWSHHRNAVLSEPTVPEGSDGAG